MGGYMEKQNIFAISVAAFVLIIVFAVSNGLVKYWNRNVSDIKYDREAVTMMDICDDDKDGNPSITTEEKTTDSGKKYNVYTFTCVYNNYYGN